MSKLGNNNTKLQNILDTINKLLYVDECLRPRDNVVVRANNWRDKGR